MGEIVTCYLTSTLATATYLAWYRRGIIASGGSARPITAGTALLWCSMQWGVEVSRSAFAAVFPPVLPHSTILGLLGGEAEASNDPTLSRLLWHRYKILQSILTLIIASVGGIARYILALRRGTPYREEARRAGQLELDGEEARGPQLPRAARWALRPIASMLGP